jgi:hypothetical protein
MRLLPFVFLSYFVNYIDRAKVSFANLNERRPGVRRSHLWSRGEHFYAAASSNWSNVLTLLGLAYKTAEPKRSKPAGNNANCNVTFITRHRDVFCVKACSCSCSTSLYQGGHMKAVGVALACAADY